MKEITKAYKCDHCGRIFATKSGAANHEKCCPKNPKNISMCKDCIHLTANTKTWEEETYGGYGTVTRKSTDFYCEKFDKHMYHPKALRMLPETRDAILTQADTKMPTVDEGCEGFEYPSVISPFDELIEEYL